MKKTELVYSSNALLCVAGQVQLDCYYSSFIRVATPVKLDCYENNLDPFHVLLLALPSNLIVSSLQRESVICFPLSAAWRHLASASAAGGGGQSTHPRQPNSGSKKRVSLIPSHVGNIGKPMAKGTLGKWVRAWCQACNLSGKFTHSHTGLEPEQWNRAR